MITAVDFKVSMKKLKYVFEYFQNVPADTNIKYFYKVNTPLECKKLFEKCIQVTEYSNTTQLCLKVIFLILFLE